MNEVISENKKRIPLTALEAAVISVLAVLAIHDTNTAAGAGYLLYLQMGGLSRMGWDLIVDAWIVLLTVLCTFVPSILFKTGYKGQGVFFLAGTALLELIRPDRLLAPFSGGEAITRDAAVYSLLSFLPVWMMIAVAVYILYRLPGTSEKESDHAGLCACASMVLMFVSVIFPVLFEICIFASGYILLVPAARQIPKMKYSGQTFLGTVLFLGSFWRLYQIMATYHM